MKRILAALICLFGTAAVFAQAPTVNKLMVQQKMKPSSSTNAHKKGVIMIKMVVDATFTEVDANNDPIEKECPAVRIAPNTLLASRACIDLSGKGELHRYVGAGAGPDISIEKVNRWISSIKVNDVTLGQDKFRQNDLLLAIAVDGNQPKLKEIIQKMPITDLFVAKNVETLKTVFPEMTLNRDDMMWGRECASVDIVNVCTESQCFQVCWKMIDGDTGDPVFGRNPNTDNFEYLLGFNVRNSKLNKRKSGRWYHFLSQSSLDFFKTNLSKEDWAYIKAHAKDENIYK